MNKEIIYIDDVVHEIRESKIDFTGVVAGAHVLKVEKYKNDILQATAVRNITVSDSASSYDPDYQEVLNYATTNSIPIPSESESSRRNQLIIDHKATGAWAKDDVFFDFGGSADPAFKLICCKRRVQAIAYGDLTWSVDGVEGNGTNGWIDSLFVPDATSNWQLNNAGAVAYLNNLVIGTMSLMGSENVTTFWIPMNSASVGYASINQGSKTQAHNNVPQIGLNALNRISSSETNIMGNGLASYTSVSSTSTPSVSIGILGRHKGGGVADYFSTESVKYFTLGASKTTTEFNALKTVLV